MHLRRSTAADSHRNSTPRSMSMRSVDPRSQPSHTEANSDDLLKFLRSTSNDKATFLCPHCRAEDTVAHVEALAVDRHSRVTYFKCRACDTVFLNPDQSSDSFYLRTEKTPATEKADFLKYHLEIGAGVDFMVQVIDQLITENTRTFASVGCGAGVDLDIASKNHPQLTQVVGFEPHDYGRSQDLEPLIRHHPFGSQHDDGVFDAILALEVIEHVTDHRAFLSSLKAGLSESGRLMLTTPNAHVVEDHKAVHEVYHALFPGEHRMLFTPETLEQSLREAGFAHVRVSVQSGHLTALASDSVLHEPKGQSVAPGRERILAYLQSSLRSIAPLSESSMAAGQAFRLLSEWSAQGATEPMLELLRSRQALNSCLDWSAGLPVLSETCMQAALKCSSHAEYVSSVRVFMGPLAYHLAMLALIKGNAAVALRALDQAIGLIQHENELDPLAFQLSWSLLMPALHEHWRLCAAQGLTDRMHPTWASILRTESRAEVRQQILQNGFALLRRHHLSATSRLPARLIAKAAKNGWLTRLAMTQILLRSGQPRQEVRTSLRVAQAAIKP